MRATLPQPEKSLATPISNSLSPALSGKLKVVFSIEHLPSGSLRIGCRYQFLSTYSIFPLISTHTSSMKPNANLRVWAEADLIVVFSHTMRRDSDLPNLRVRLMRPRRSASIGVHVASGFGSKSLLKSMPLGMTAG